VVLVGLGNSVVSAPASSAEMEVPFKAVVLVGLTKYDRAEGRVARKYNLASGDTTCALGLAFIPGMTMSVYNTKYPIQYCFIDLDEVVIWLQAWYGALVSQNATIGNGSFSEKTSAYTPFTYSPQLFRIAVRQTVLGFFATSQAMGQFMTYSEDSQGFEPFRVGLNCVGSNRMQMTMPLILIENIRMLLPKFLTIPTNYQNPKNQLVSIPVWGIYKANETTPYNLNIPLWDGSALVYQNLFLGANTNDPSPIDGVDNIGNICNLNSGNISDFIIEWNVRVDLLKSASLPCAFLGGNSSGNLLLYTRFANYHEIDVNLDKISPFMRENIPKQYIKRTKVTRVISKGKTVEEEVLEYIPQDGTLFNQFNLAFSSLPGITESAKFLTNYLIYPSMVIERDTPPTQRQARVALVQSHLLSQEQATYPIVSSRGNKLTELGRLCAPGLAASDSDELSQVLMQFSKENEGGFIGSLLGSLATELPF